jgi:squalene cyclase
MLRAVLRENQNSDGGWGYHVGSQSRVEPTCWALSALSEVCDAEQDSKALSKAQDFLLSTQDKAGFWTASPEMTTGNWVTSLACAVLSRKVGAESASSAGLAWLCSDYPLDSSLGLRLVRRFLSKDRRAQDDDSGRGWGWTPRTSSWVEPTSFALLALQQFHEEQLPTAMRRRDLAEALLYERMCPDGGWNCGNPRVYGVAGEALVLPTAWALLALRVYPDHMCKSLSLAWLEGAIPQIKSPGSLAVATLCFEAYGRKLPGTKFSLRDFAVESLLEDGIHVLAWVCLSLNPDRTWPARAEGMK